MEVIRAATIPDRFYFIGRDPTRAPNKRKIESRFGERSNKLICQAKEGKKKRGEREGEREREREKVSELKYFILQ